ncbi:MAG: ATP-dependent helicase [Desulfomonilaceae bacterium]
MLIKVTGQTIDYSKQMNPEQYEAASAPDGPVLVIAGAGSGKTRTIVFRVAWLIDRGIDPHSILLLTFTRKAAMEMLNRASTLLDGRASMVYGGTFHSVGYSLLRKYSSHIGIDRTFSIMDQRDILDAVDQARKNLKPPVTDLKSFPKARTIYEILSRSVGSSVEIEHVIQNRYPHFEEFTDELRRISQDYQDIKRQNRLLDYDDLLTESVRLLEENEELRNHISCGWRYLLVDEYQDTNRLQAKMVRMLASDHDNVMAVGDDSQSIYSFRGANFQNIMEFPNIFPGARIIKLEENYRSTQPILNVTNQIIDYASLGYRKRLFTRMTSGPLPFLVRPVSEQEQSRIVTRLILDSVKHGGSLNDIAVLFRAGFHSFELEAELARGAIPFVKYGGFKFVESQHIKDVLAYLKVSNNPVDLISWMRVLKMIPGVGEKTAVKFSNAIANDYSMGNLALVAHQAKKNEGLLLQVFEVFNQLRNSELSLIEKLELLTKHYSSYLQANFDNYPKRLKDLEQLTAMASSYASVSEFLADVALEPPETEQHDYYDSLERVTLSTIHSAKGLEWQTVIIIWATEGRIPSPMAFNSPEDLEEERRLIYVATTRAKRNLVVIAPQTVYDRRLGTVPVGLSRFFEQVSPDSFQIFQT